MLPLRVISYVERPPPAQPSVAPVQRRPDPGMPAKLPAAGLAGPPRYERRMQGDRRVNERREKEQSAFLDTRTPQGRRRSSGRRAEDQFQPEFRIAISIKV
ncbi:hypothetical protein KY495_09685 [Massilia sp. PAMC28688]|uniref:hypothetical protein n=1 Tax=Massilia sp. PAMC28688 TaxID=2861283 RepID=UPI001C62E641|nr:hypothetical protein [Massilia sp. PAMC28688]QYF95392.1 hypothetical protein KY495_09685 [Massilia sp. PAMC28688]